MLQIKCGRALTMQHNRHKENLFRGDLAGRLAATLKNSLNKAAVRYRPFAFSQGRFFIGRRGFLPAPADQLSTGWKK
ncbi:hypothetical protein AKO51_13030 [Brucella abortus]|nr:hypothetical protein P865_10130 [Brucella abortus 82]KPZ80634.1 hypothetical protein AKO52_09930 [Brucella abortus]KPZ81017.1 hypothetical protein AKO51_13030 [Brucella abortus]KPZ83976.1 hypothetical protein AKO50_11800 [Brucella abortus]KPZ88558.1 hypothetical protein AKO49_12905 [Brucella abortus]